MKDVLPSGDLQLLPRLGVEPNRGGVPRATLNAVAFLTEAKGRI